MTKRLLILIVLLSGTCAAAYAYTHWKYLCEESYSPDTAPIVQVPDDFDIPYQSDPGLVKEFAGQAFEFPFRNGDRVAWIGSSSTYIGTWCKTMEFLLRTRHPSLNLTFSRHSSGSGTFQLAAARLPDWLQRSHPTLVFFNYGANDAAYGKRTLDAFHDAMGTCVKLAKNSGARVVFTTHQSGDLRQTGSAAFYRRKHYADDMLSFCRTNGWDVVDVFHPLEELQAQGEAQDSDFTINSDIIHLTDSAYAAWGFYLYDRLNPPAAESSLEIDARDGRIAARKNCTARIVSSGAVLSFEREDSVLPILPPFPLPQNNPSRGRIAMLPKFAPVLYSVQNGQKPPSRKNVPFEKRSRYMLKITGLPPGDYALECNAKPAGKASDKEFAAVVNLNTLYLDAGVPAPWNDLASQIWDGARLGEATGRRLIFKLTRLTADGSSMREP